MPWYLQGRQFGCGLKSGNALTKNFSFSSGFLSTILLSFLSYSLFLLQQTQLRAIVVKCDGSVYEVDVDVPAGSDSDPNLSNGFNNIKAS